MFKTFVSFEKNSKIMKEVTVTIIGEGYALVVKKPTEKLTDRAVLADYKTIFDLQADGHVEEESYAFEYIGMPGRVQVFVDDEDCTSSYSISNDSAWVKGYKIEDLVQRPFVIGWFEQGKMEVTYKIEMSDRAKFNIKKLKLVTGDMHVMGAVTAAKIVYDGKEIEPEYDIMVEYDRDRSRIIGRAL